MYTDVKDLINQLGGYRDFAGAIGMKPKTVQFHMQGGKIPAAHFFAVVALADSKNLPWPGAYLFSFNLDAPGAADAADRVIDPRWDE